MSRYPHDEPYYDDSPGYRPSSEPQRHSGLGVASFIIGLVVILLDVLAIFLVIIVAAGEASRPWSPGRRDAAEAMAVLTGIIFCGGAVAALVGLGLGFGSLFQEDRKKGLGIAGVILNSLVLLALLTLVMIGLLASGRPFFR
jgi:hypothetical protein